MISVGTVLSMGKKIALTSSDGKEFVVDQAVAMESHMIRDMIEVDCADGTIPVANVDSTILTKVLEYCMKHAAVSDPKGGDDEELKEWDAEFAKVDLDTLYDLILAANYLNVKGLLDLICQTVANMIRGKMPDEIRATFKIKNDFTPEQEEEYRKKNSWVFESIEEGAL